MASSHKLFLLSSSFDKMVLERKLSSLETKKFLVLRPKICRAILPSYCQAILRRSANYQPSIWNHDYIQSLRGEHKGEFYVKQRNILREEVRVNLCELVDQVDQLEMIDLLQRLGVAYHFNIEIRNIMETVHNNMQLLKGNKSLYEMALTFRLLRQHGFLISSDVFLSFQDKLINFNECLTIDIEGMLSLYEASFHSFESESILDQTKKFTINFIKEYVNTNRDSDLSRLIHHALELPLQRREPRWEALWFMKFLYEKKRQNTSRHVLQFAELDFNLVQSNHQEELKYMSRWWKTTGLAEELSFFRDRLVENFVWSIGVSFKPEDGNMRKVITKAVTFITMIDDIYDVYGTLEEIELFTKVIDSWDLNALDSLPLYMQKCFLTVYNFVQEVAFVGQKNEDNIVPHLSKVWGDLCKSYLVEAKWYQSRGYAPTLQEYMDNGWMSIGAHVVLMHAYFSCPTPLIKEDMFCLKQYPNLIRYSGLIVRLADDLATYKREEETGDILKSIQCYMNETGASETESCEHIKCIISKTWKKMNEEALTSSLPKNFIDIVINLARAAIFVYQHGDGFTSQDHGTKSRIETLVMQPVSTISK